MFPYCYRGTSAFVYTQCDACTAIYRLQSVALENVTRVYLFLYIVEYAVVPVGYDCL